MHYVRLPPWWKYGVDFSFLLEDERGEKRDYFLGLIGSKVFQANLGENELATELILQVM